MSPIVADTGNAAAVWTSGLIAGVDEVGRGPIAGPVLAAAVILHPDRPIPGLADSKQMTARQREQFDVQIRETALAWALGRAEVEEIDHFNILQASLLAMQRAVAALHIVPAEVWVDGNRTPSVNMKVRAIVGGDATVPAISAASIVAKVSRDAELCTLDQTYPGYGFAQHKGYPTPAHLEALDRMGASAIHRRSFAPVQRCLAKAG